MSAYTPIDWHESAEAQSILRGLNTRNCWQIKRLAFFGQDGSEWCAPCNAQKKLEALRAAAVAADFGMSWDVAGRHEATGNAYLACDARAPGISDVLELTFARRERRAPRVLFKGRVQGDAELFREIIESGIDQKVSPVGRAAA